MTRILHLSDLHYGRSTPALEEPLLERIEALAPDLVVVSGDFTQRARLSQFTQAREFLDRLRVPWLAVPGNHDTPLDNIFVRFFKPFSRYKRFITRDLEPVFRKGPVVVRGVNSVNPYAWKSGRLSRGTLRRLTRCFAEGEQDEKAPLQIAVLHHPLEMPPDHGAPQMRHAAEVLHQLAEAGADVVLSGHLHMARSQPFTTAPGLLFVQAGTGLSTRLRGEQNTFNLLDCGRDRVEISTWAARESGFVKRDGACFQREELGWQREEAAAPAKDKDDRQEG